MTKLDPQRLSEPYTRMTAQLYDAVYGWKDYRAEASRLLNLVDRLVGERAQTMLDVACGTGRHLPYLSDRLRITGIDISPDQVSRAQERLPNGEFHVLDMCDFDLGCTYDVVTCLFSSVAYASTLDRMRAAVGAMARHVAPGGILVLEPWPAPVVVPGELPRSTYAERPNVTVCRMHTLELIGDVSVIHFHHLVGTAEGVEYFVERHEVGVYTRAEYLDAVTATGLTASADDDGLTGRGLVLGLNVAGGRQVPDASHEPGEPVAAVS